MAFGANKGTWLFGANSIVANNQATLSTGSAVVAQGDLIVVVIGEVVANTSSGATDTLGNTYTAITAGTLVGATVSGRAFYTIVTNPGTNTNINVQATASSNNVAIVAASYEGSFSAIDKQPANNNNTDNASPFTCPATGALAQQLEVIVAWMVDNTANVKSATSPNIKANQQSQTTVSSVLGHQVVNVTTTVSPAFTGTNPTASIQGTATFRAAALPVGDIAYSYPITPLVSGSWRLFRSFISARNPNLLADEVTPPPPADTDTLRAPYFSPPRQPQTLLYDIPINLLTGPLRLGPFKQLDWPLTKAAQPANNLLTWSWQYNPNLIGQDQLPVGEISTALTVKAYEYHVSLRSWAGMAQPPAPLGIVLPPGTVTTDLTPRPYIHHVALRNWIWNYNLNLIGRDQFPVGKIVAALPPTGYEYPSQLRAWSLQGPVYIPVVAPVVLPFRQNDWPVPKGYEFSISLRSWTTSPRPVEIVIAVEAAVFRAPHFTPPRELKAFTTEVRYNAALYAAPAAVPFRQLSWPLTLAAVRSTDLSTWISQTKLLLAVPFSQSDWPVPAAQRPQGRTFTASYNLNLIGQDKLPTGAEITDLPPREALRASDLRTWINSAALALVTTPPPKPFAQYDWPLNFGPLQPTTIFTAVYNKNLIGQDKLPNGEIVTDLPPRAPQQPTPIFTATYNKNLVGKDQLPTGAEITDLPPQPALSAIQLRTWINFTSLALLAGPVVRPFVQSDWPINIGPRQPIQVFTASYNRNLIGQDQLPTGEIVTALPTQQRLAAQTWINAVNLALSSAQVTPFNQVDWQRPIAAVPFNRSFAAFYNPNLIGKDRLPFRQQDWPLYRPFLQPSYGYSASYNRNLIGKDRLPIRQMYWPVPPEFRRLSDWIVRTNPNLFVPPIPPPEILPRDPTHLRTRSGFELDARGQPSLDQRGAGIDARGPSSVDRRGSDRFNRGRNES